MPLYEFVCTACSHTFDELLTASRRDEPRICPECGAATQRKVSMVASGRKSGTTDSSGGKSCSSCSSHHCGSCS